MDRNRESRATEIRERRLLLLLRLCKCNECYRNTVVNSSYLFMNLVQMFEQIPNSDDDLTNLASFHK